MTMVELHGHGDPLFAVAMKGAVTEKDEASKEVTAATVSHQVAGHGDELFHAVLKHDTPMNPLHSELKGQGDPLMEAIIEEWHVVEKDSRTKLGKAEAVHEEMKIQGDPMLRASMIHNMKVSGIKLI